MPRTHGSTTQRGYGAQHQAEKRRLQPLVASGQAYCTEPICLEELDGYGRWLDPDQPWHLAHDRDNGGYHGPAHARCNTSEGATYGNQQRGHALAHEDGSDDGTHSDALDFFE